MLTHSVKSLPLGRTVFATAAFLFISLCAGGEARADFMNLLVVQDNPARMVITIEHVAAAGGVLNVQIGQNWNVALNEVNFGNGLNIAIRARHINGPHQEDVNPNQNMLPAFEGPLVPGVTVIPLTVVGPLPHPTEHFDWLQYTYTTVGAGKSRLTIQLDHTTDMNQPSFLPEPATLLLLGTGLAGIAAGVRRRRESSRGKVM